MVVTLGHIQTEINIIIIFFSNAFLNDIDLQSRNAYHQSSRTYP